MATMDWLDKISRFWPHIAAGFDFLAAVLASIHALLHKRDPRAATLWLGLVWFLPLLGPILYLALGVNRIRRRALTLAVHKTFSRPVPENLGEPQHEGAEHLKMLARTVNRFVAQPLTAGNKIEPLVNGDAAFPAMLAAIESAKKSVTLCTYIFDNDASGRQFVAALARAVARGVAVRVLVDAAGTRYSWPPITYRSAAQQNSVRQIPARVALHALARRHHQSPQPPQIADRGWNHRLHRRHQPPPRQHPRRQPENLVQDLQFKISGPVVAQLQEAFANDWAFTTGEALDGEIWFPELKSSGSVIARVVTDGPDGDFEKWRWTLLAALAEAQSSIQILTPYFLPDVALIAALNLAALRGVRVDIILPAKNNLPFVHWASRAMWWQVLERGCRVWLTPPPFDHSKLMIVDGHWVSLRLGQLGRPQPAAQF